MHAVHTCSHPVQGQTYHRIYTPQQYLHCIFSLTGARLLSRLKSKSTVVLAVLFIPNQTTANPPVLSLIHFVVRKLYRRQPHSTFAVLHWATKDEPFSLPPLPLIITIRRTHLTFVFNFARRRSPRISHNLLTFLFSRAKLVISTHDQMVFVRLSKVQDGCVFFELKSTKFYRREQRG